MAPHLTDHISIQIKAEYLEDHSFPSKRQYLFAYQIAIQNQYSKAVQLLSRHWYIFDSYGAIKEVKGEGVVGKQPIIKPGESHEYQSFCELKTDMGMMWGNYLMKDCETDRLFEVKIPEFQLIDPARLN
ncbi:MAG: Co2+/Mg2+ efflux protein ApaG [Vicingaceae bacterium]